MARQANVASSRELLRLAIAGRTKLINYISTLGVFTPTTHGTPRRVEEATSIDQERHSTASGYLASKWVAEKIFLTANDRGIPCNIFRLGFIWADTEQGRYDELQREYRVVKSCLLSGYGIKAYRYAMAPTPVDYAARAIVALARRHAEGHGVFHISCSSNEVNAGVFETCNRIADLSLKLIERAEWIERIKQIDDERRPMPIVPLIDSASFEDQSKTTLWFDASRTRHELEREGIVEPPFTERALRVFLEAMYRRDSDLQAQDRFEKRPLQDAFTSPAPAVSQPT